MNKKESPRNIYAFRFKPEGMDNFKKVAKTAKKTVVALLREAASTAYGVEL